MTLQIAVGFVEHSSLSAAWQNAVVELLFAVAFSQSLVREYFNVATVWQGLVEVAEHVFVILVWQGLVDAVTHFEVVVDSFAVICATLGVDELGVLSLVVFLFLGGAASLLHFGTKSIPPRVV